MTKQNHRAKKRFGQHFLHDAGVIARIVATIAPNANETVVEIGPGLGALTLPLLEQIKTLEAVELDRDVVEHLQMHADEVGTLNIHQADALEFDFSSLYVKGKPFVVVGNLPYNISTPLIFHLLSQAAPIDRMVFMLQLEVVERLAAEPGGKNYGRLSVMAQYACAVTHHFSVNRGAFNPPPKVESAIVSLKPYERPPYIANDKTYFAALVAQAFSQRRKTLGKSLKDWVSPAQFEQAGVDASLRPEVLSVDAFVKLSNVSLK